MFKFYDGMIAASIYEFCPYLIASPDCKYKINEHMESELIRFQSKIEQKFASSLLVNYTFPITQKTFSQTILYKSQSKQSFHNKNKHKI